MVYFLLEEWCTKPTIVKQEWLTFPSAPNEGTDTLFSSTSMEEWRTFPSVPKEEPNALFPGAPLEEWHTFPCTT